jgi:hypothetical protein
VWSPGQKQEFKLPEGERGELPIKDEPISPVWTPKSATSSPTVERKEFRPVKFESPVLSRKGYSKEEPFEDSKEPPWKVPERSSDTGVVLASTLQKRLPTSHSSPASGFNDLPTTRLPRAQNPTITLLQKARGMCVRVYLRGCGCKSFMAHEGTKNMHLKCDVHFGKALPFTFLMQKKNGGGKYPRNCFCS